MQVHLNAVNSNTIGFKKAYTVQGVYLNGEYFGRNSKKTIYKVTRALSLGMQNRTLSPAVSQTVKKFFPDFSSYPFVMAVRNHGNVYPKRVGILTAYDAQEYKNVSFANYDYEDKLDVEDWTLNKIMSKTGNKKIKICAEEKNGQIIINDILMEKKK